MLNYPKVNFGSFRKARATLSVLALFLAQLSSLGQDQLADQVDSLVQEMTASINDLPRMRDIALSTLEIGVENDFTPALVAGNKFLGIFHNQTSSYDSALHYYNTWIELMEPTDTLEMSKAYMNLATTYSATGNYDLCVEYALKAVGGFESINATVWVGRSLNLLGLVYYQQGDSRQALHYFNEYYKASLKTDSKVGIGESMNNIGAMYQDLGMSDSAIYFFTNSIQFKREVKQLFGLGNTYQNIGGMYMDMNEYEQAQIHYDSALVYYERYGDKRQMGATYLNMGRMNWQDKKYQLALIQAQKAKIIGAEVGDRYTERNAYRLISRLLEATGRHIEALDAFEEFYKLDTALFNESKTETVEELRTVYETEKKDREIAELNLEQANNLLSIQQRDQRISRNTNIIIGLVLLFISGFAVVLWWRGRMKLNQKMELASQEEKLQKERLKAVIESQEDERKRFARDLHDSLGPQLTTLKMELDQDSVPREKLIDDLGGLAEEIREIAFGLMPQVLQKKGLRLAFEEFAQRVNKIGEINIHVDMSDLKSMKESIEVGIYRICQEWINNVLKHSDARNINLQFTREDSSLLISIEDDGRGFDPVELEKGSGHGWQNIRTRADILNANVYVESNPGKSGSVLFLRLQTS